MPLAEQPIALVTGASRGIGRGIALQLAKDGYGVLINHVSPADPDSGRGPYEVKARIEEAGGLAEVFQANVAVADERKAMVEFACERFGRIDLLVNNAGVAPRQRTDLLEASEESFDELMGINLKGPYFLTQMVANRMIAWKEAGVTPSPRVVFVSSISAYATTPARGEYCVSKAGVSMASRLFAHRLGEYGIPVIEVSPGVIRTDMTSTVQEKYDRLILQEGLLTTGRWGEPEDVAKVVSAVGQGLLDYSTGECIEVGGGFRMLRL